MNEVKVRFAPSPTGFLHIGSARTALFNWLFARHEGGKFFLRIEDTDKERSRDEFLEEILDSLRWLGLAWDGEPVFQSRRTDLYRAKAEELLKKDLAYHEDKAIRFRFPKEGKIVFDDLLHGRIEFDTAANDSLKEDLVIFKSDGSPTYNFAVVCDDAEMGITHVIRGDDHISNTPKQVPLYRALGLRMPVFCHIPLILGEDRSRMSKRHGATSIREYRQAGILPEAAVNYLALLGWSPGNNQEILSRDELVAKFALKRVLKTGAIFSKEKLEWMNGQYIRKLSARELMALLKPDLVSKGLWNESGDEAWLEKLVALYRERLPTLSRFNELAEPFFRDEVRYSEEVSGDLLKDPRLKGAFKRFAQVLEGVVLFDAKSIEEGAVAMMKELALTPKEFIHPCRVALTGKKVSPGFYDTVSLVGRTRAVARLYGAIEFMEKNSPGNV